jgi:dienelactone hydrolase
MQREEIEFQSHGVLCRGWYYRPQGDTAGPCIVMAHGFGGTRDAGLEPYAEVFAEAGYGVLVFDYRHFGASDGEPRQLLSVSRQLADWAAAIAWVRAQPEVDAEKVALWGSSFSGGHVIVAAARDGRIAAVSAQGPMMDGMAAVTNLIGYAGVGTVMKLTGLGVVDQLRAVVGGSPVYIPIIAPPGQFAVMSSADADAGYSRITPPDWRNEVTPRAALGLALYRPITSASKVRCPVLILACGRDSVAPVSAARATAKRIGDNAELKVYDFGHFDIYVDEGFRQSSGDQLRFFNRVFGRG